MNTVVVCSRRLQPSGIPLTPMAKAIDYRLYRYRLTASSVKITLMLRSKPHRLPLETYQGRKAIAFTACLTSRQPYFVLNEVVDPHVKILTEEVRRHHCVCYCYCFMPDHLHVILVGLNDQSNGMDAFKRFKQRSGYLLRLTEAHWGKSFYDHILRPKDTAAQTMYVINIPVRAKLCNDPFAYPFSGTIDMDWSDVLNSAIDL